MSNSQEYCENCKKYMLNGGKCTGVRSRHCKKYRAYAETKKQETGKRMGSET